MDAVTVLITGAGAPGIKGTLYSLENNFDSREIRTIGTDINDQVVGGYLCDKFFKISRPFEKDYLMQLLSICKEEHVDVLLPQNTVELPVLASHKKDFEEIGTKIAVSSEHAIEIANDKYKLLKTAREIGIPTPKFFIADNLNDLIEYAEYLGWPQNPIVVKPPVSNGMRGLRIINESINFKDIFYNEKPTGVYIKMENLRDILGPSFPSLLVMEHLEKDEYTVDILRSRKTTIIPRKRDLVKSGITFNGTIEKNEAIIEYSERLSKEIGLSSAYGFQFKLDQDNEPKILESNPRIQGTMVLSTFAGANIIYGAVKYALNEDIPEFKIKWGTKILRYWGGIGINENKVVGSL
jgi:carbamoyl-phosphate synthase large subunit